MKDLFRYVPGRSVIHRMNPVTKLLLTVVICVAAFITGNIFVLLGLLAADLAIGFIAGVPGKTLNILKGLMKIAIFLFVLQALLYPCPVSDISGHDNYIGLVAFWLGQVVYDPNAYINYRQTGQNLSITGTTKWNKLMKNFAYFKIRMTRRRSIHERNAKELLSHYGETHGPELKELRAVAEYRQSLPKRLALLCNARFKRFSLPIRVFNDVLIILGKL